MAYVDEKTKQLFLSFKPDELGIKKQTWLFSKRVDPKTKAILPPRYNQTDRVKLKAHEYINDTDVDTTLGRIVFNKICIEPYVAKAIGFWNTPLDKDGIGAIYGAVGKALRYGKITTDDAWAWEKAIEFYSLKAAPIYNPSYSSNMLIPKKELLDIRDEFIKNNPNATTADYVKLEKELASKATAKIKDDPSIGVFNSGARGSIADQYKNISMLVGPVYNPATASMEPITTSLIEGFKKEDLPKAGNMLISGVYPKSCATADSGYITKQYYAAFQSVCVDVDGSDCKTKSHLKILITEKNWYKYEFQNIIDGDKIVTLTEDNYTKYIGKVVKLRSPMCCTGEKVCSVCAGRMPYITGLTNIGITFATVPNSMLNAGMKKFHTSAVNMDYVDPDKLLF